MKQRHFEATGCFPPTQEFQPVFAMDKLMRAQPMNEIFPYHPPTGEPVIQVGLDHLPKESVYNFAFTPTDWHVLPGEHHKKYEVVIDREIPEVQLSVFGTVLHPAFGLQEQGKWIRLQFEKGMFLPHPAEVEEFLLIFAAFTKYIGNKA